MNRYLLLGLCMTAISGCAAPAPAADPDDLRVQVMEAERAFARTMAERDHDGFRRFLSEDAIFFSGETAIRGRDAIAAAWQPYYAGPDAPFSWDPDQVQVLDSGDLALSTGPVLDPQGNLTGRFNSIWQRQPGGDWRVVFDKGSPVCDCAAADAP